MERLQRFRLTLGLAAIALVAIIVLSTISFVGATHYPIQLYAGDVNCDGDTNIIDALIIAQHDALIEVPDFPGCPHPGQAIP